MVHVRSSDAVRRRRERRVLFPVTRVMWKYIVVEVDKFSPAYVNMISTSVPVTTQREVPIVQTMQKTAEAPQVQHIDKGASSKRVRFDLGARTVREVTPYAEVYGKHPRDFVFGANFEMVPAGGQQVDALDHLLEEGSNTQDVPVTKQWQVAMVQDVPNVSTQDRHHYIHDERIVDTNPTHEKEEFVHAPETDSQERIQKQIVEQPVDALIPMTNEDVAHVPKIIPQERIQQRIEKQIVDIPAPVTQQEVAHDQGGGGVQDHSTEANVTDDEEAEE